MKRYLYFAVAVAFAASCAKESPKEDTPNTDPVVPSVEGQVPVQFSSNVVANVTKSTGAVDQWGGQELHIYGFPRTTGQKPDYNNPFISNVKADAPASGMSDKIDVKTEDSEDFYYSGTTTYDFFGYYVDDAAEATPTKGDDAYTLDVTINGGQDIMVAKADPAYAAEKAFASAPQPEGWDNRYAFSAYAARRGVHPILKFEHLLTQLKFNVESGTDFNSNPQVYVESVKIIDVNTTATLTVAGDVLGFGETAGTPDTLEVMTKATDNLEALTKVIVPSTGSPAVAIGVPIMLFPAAEYTVEFTLSQEGVNKEVAPIKKTISIAEIEKTVEEQTEFTAGYAYSITIKVYGLEKVDITAELSEWEDGGSISIDTDEAPEIL